MKAIIEAFVAVQAAATAPKKTTSNAHFGSKFADLAEVLNAIRAPLVEHGLAVVQTPSVSSDGKMVSIQTTIYHRSGETMDCGILSIPVERAGPQAVGSAITYGRRYGLMALFFLAPEVDDDGEGAEDRKAPAGKAQGKPARGLDDVAGSASARPLAGGSAQATQAPRTGPAATSVKPPTTTTQTQGTAEPSMPKGPPPIVPAGEFAGRSVDTLPIAYLRDTLPNVKIPANRAWFEYLIAMADQEI